MKLRVVNEWDVLDTVIVGTAASMGGTPTVAESYDPKSKEHIRAGTFPTEADCQRELNGLASLLKSHGVRVLRPNTLQDVNQLFARDVGAVVEDRLVATRMIEDRAAEWEGIAPLLSGVSESHILRPPAGVRIEGGDVMPMNGELWVGYSAPEDFDHVHDVTNQRSGPGLALRPIPRLERAGVSIDQVRRRSPGQCPAFGLLPQRAFGGHALVHLDGLKLAEDRSFMKTHLKAKCTSSTRKRCTTCSATSFQSPPLTWCPAPHSKGVNQQLDLGATTSTPPR